MDNVLKLLLPKGHLQEKVMDLWARIGLKFRTTDRSYRMVCDDLEIEAKMLRPQNIPRLLELGRHDCGFSGLDWVTEEDADVVELLDLGFDPVRLVAAVSEEHADVDPSTRGKLVVASEYHNITMAYCARKGIDADFVESYGATEALPPEDADMIVDNTSTGTTLAKNGLTIIDDVMTSTTRFLCHKGVLEDPWKKQKLDEICMLMRSALAADKRVLLEMNVPPEQLEAVVELLPCMKSPTVSHLYKEDGFAVKAAVPSSDVPRLIPKLKELGARDILEYKLEKIVE